MRIKAASAPSDKLGGVLAEILALVHQREGLKMVDLTAEIQSLVREYRAKVEADRQDLVREMAEEDARINAESTIMFKSSARSEELEQKYEHLSSQVAEAEAAVMQAKAAL